VATVVVVVVAMAAVAVAVAKVVVVATAVAATATDQHKLMHKGPSGALFSWFSLGCSTLSAVAFYVNNQNVTAGRPVTGLR
jgi:hypothetical protein